MASFDVEVIGDEPGDIQSRLAKLGVQGQTRANRALLQTAEEVKDEIEETAPVDTGEYQNSWYILQVAEDEVWILSSADHAKFVMLPNQVMVNSSRADLPASGILHNVEGIAKGHQKQLKTNFAEQLKRMINNFRVK